MIRFLKILTLPFTSRKGAIAVATIIGTYLGHYKLNVSPEVIAAVVFTAATWIASIAIEDAGANIRDGKGPS